MTLLLGNGDGTFALGDVYTFDQELHDVAAGDLNEDGLTDLVVSGAVTAMVQVLLGNGDGTLQPPLSYGGVAMSRAVCVVDLDGDGHLDLVAATSDTVVMFPGCGDGTFATAMRFGPRQTSTAVFAGDISNDGVIDVVTSSEANDTLTLLPGGLRWQSVIDMPRGSGALVAGDTLRLAGHGTAKAGVASFRWDLGDQRSSSLEDPGLVTFLKTGTKLITMAVVDRNGVADPRPASRSITVVADTGDLPDLAVSRVDVPDDLAPGQQATIAYQVTNRGKGVLSGATWHDALYLSTDEYLDREDVALARSGSRSERLGVGGTYDGSLDVVIPADSTEGTYYLLLSVDDGWEVLEQHQLNNESAVALNVLIPVLTDDVPRTARFTPASRLHRYRIEVPPGQNLQLYLDGVHATAANELYVRHGELPTRTVFDAKSDAVASADQELFVSGARPGTWYVLAYAAINPGAYTLVADLAVLAVDEVSPRQFVGFAPAALVLRGGGFDAQTQVALVGVDGTVYPPRRVAWNSYAQLTVEFAADAVPAGTYDLRVTRPDLVPAEVLNAVEVLSAGEGILETNLILPSALGYHAVATLYVEYCNTGNLAMRAPLLVVDAEQNGRHAALLTLDRQRVTQGLWTTAIPEGFGNQVQILASGATPGMLLPGETMRVPVYYVGWQRPWDYSYSPIHFSVSVLDGSEPTPVDWNALREELQPDWLEDEAWQPIWANYVDQVGDTWGDYVTMLAENATYLASLGVVSVDVGQLFNFELRQADGLNPNPYVGTVRDFELQAPGLS